MLEKDIEQRLARVAKSRGAWMVKWTAPGTVGVPDRILIAPGGRIVFVQLKTQTGKLSPAQERVHKQLRSLGCDVRVVYGLQQGMALIEEVLS